MKVVFLCNRLSRAKLGLGRGSWQAMLDACHGNGTQEIHYSTGDTNHLSPHSNATDNPATAPGREVSIGIVLGPASDVRNMSSLSVIVSHGNQPAPGL